MRNVWVRCLWTSVFVLFFCSVQDVESAKLKILTNTDYPGGDYRTVRRVALKKCEQICYDDENCKAFTYNQKHNFCFLKSKVGNPTSFVGATSGFKLRAETLARKNAAIKNRSIARDDATKLQSPLERLKSTNRCISCNLSGANLSGLDLSSADLRSANLTNTNFNKTKLRSANLANADLNGAKLFQADLERAVFFNANLSNANLTGANLTETNFRGANLSNASFDESKLDGALLVDSKNQPDDLKKIASKQKKEEEAKKLAEEKFIKQKDQEHKRQVKEDIRVRLPGAESNPGFRDIRPGYTFSEIKSLSGCSLRDELYRKCYDIDNLRFKGVFSKGILTKLIVDLGPIVQSDSFVFKLSEYVAKENPNILSKMTETLGKKYQLEFGFNERDRQLFNEMQKSNLYIVYERGQVALRLFRKQRAFSKDLWLHLEYRDKNYAGFFYNERRPVRAEADDF